MSAAELDACLAALSEFGVERLSRRTAQQRREVGAGLEKLQAETAKTLRMHTVQSLNPRAKPRETIAALLDEMKRFVGSVCSHVTEVCLDRWDAEIESYSADMPVKGRLLMQEYTDTITNEQADRKARSEQELEKKLERMRAASQAEVETRAQSALHGLRKEQEQAFARLEAAVAAGRERIAELEAQTELAEELVASLRGTLVERTQMLEEANESLRQDARIKESHQEMHLKRKDEEIRKLALERDNALRRRQGLEAEAVAEPEPLPLPLPEPVPEPEPEPDQSESTRLETAAELDALSRKLQTAVDACARVTKERDMLLTLASDRNERAEDISSLMAQLSEVTKERDLLLEVVNGAKASADAAGAAAEASGAVAAAPASTAASAASRRNASRSRHAGAAALSEAAACSSSADSARPTARPPSDAAAELEAKASARLPTSASTVHAQPGPSSSSCSPASGGPSAALRAAAGARCRLQMRAPAASAKPPGCCRTVQSTVCASRASAGDATHAVSDSAAAAAERHSSSSTRALSSGSVQKLASTESASVRYALPVAPACKSSGGGGLLSSRRTNA